MERALIIGATGMIGDHIAQALLKDKTCNKIYGCSRSPATNAKEGVEYRQLDISNGPAVKALLEELKPTVVFQAASPTAADPNGKRADYLETNVQGTTNILEAARAISECKAVVFTSSVSAYTGHSHDNVAEDHPLWDSDQLPRDISPYNETKALADTLVRQANSSELKTVSLRPCLVLGEGDRSFVPALLGQPNGVQIGDGRNKMDIVSAWECARAHVLAAQRLLDPEQSKVVGGEAFNVHGAEPVPFFDLCRELWALEGRPIDAEKVRVLSPSLMLRVARFVEGLFWVFTLGMRKPEVINTMVVLHATSEHTYNGEKARALLGFEPEGDGDAREGLGRSVKWEIEKRKRDGK